MDKDCAVYRTADLIGKRWTLLILLELHKSVSKARRYSELKKSLLDITPKMLSMRLKELGDEGLVLRSVDASVFPVRCDYSLTRSGKDFIKVIQEMKRWALQWKVQNKACEESDCKECRL